MERVYVLQHENPETNDTKLIGVYSSERLAEAAIKRLNAQPGFRDFPDGFAIDAYDLDADNWTEGFGIDG
jgi:homoserine kinase type II